MPRSAWLAVGATTAALFLPAIGPRGVAIGLAIAIGLACLAAVVPSRPRRIATVAIAAGIGLVAARILLGPTAPMTGTPEGDGPWTMRVESVGSPRDGDQVATLRSVDDGVAAFRLAATLPRYPPIEPTDIVVIEGRLRPRPDSDYGRYLERLGAWGTVDVASLRVVPTPDDPGRWLERLRRGAGDALAAVLPEPEAGLAAGILIGLRDRVDRDVAAAFTTSGVSHVVAISGWNIAIVAAAVAAVAGGLARRRRSVVTALAIVAYIAFAGASPSVLRAGAMAGVVLIARETGRAGRAAAALGWAATILLVVDPGLVGDAGFQLSTLATAGLIAWATPLTERLARIGGGRIPHWLAESLGVSLAAQAATLPVVLASFGRLAVISPLVNLAVVPLVAPAMAAGVVALGGGWLVGAGAPVVIGAVLAAPAWVALRLMIGIIDVAASIPMASLAFEPAIGTGLAIVVLILGGALRHAVTHGHRWPWGRSGAPTRSGPPIRPAQGAAVAATPRRATAAERRSRSPVGRSAPGGRPRADRVAGRHRWRARHAPAGHRPDRRHGRRAG